MIDNQALFEFYNKMKADEILSPQYALITARILTEGIGKSVFKQQNVQYDYSKLQLDEIVKKSFKDKLLPLEVIERIKTIQPLCNRAAHHGEYHITEAMAKPIVLTTELIIDWYLRTYCNCTIETFGKSDDEKTVKFEDEANAIELLSSFRSEPLVTDVISINKFPFSIGKLDGDYNDTYKFMSRKHFIIDHTNNQYFITDLDSSNKTRVNETILIPFTASSIGHGDIIRVADKQFKFLVKESYV